MHQVLQPQHLGLALFDVAVGLRILVERCVMVQPVLDRVAVDFRSLKQSQLNQQRLPRQHQVPVRLLDVEQRDEQCGSQAFQGRLFGAGAQVNLRSVHISAEPAHERLRQGKGQVRLIKPVDVAEERRVAKLPGHARLRGDLSAGRQWLANAHGHRSFVRLDRPEHVQPRGGRRLRRVEFVEIKVPEEDGIKRCLGLRQFRVTHGRKKSCFLNIPVVTNRQFKRRLE